MIPPAVGASASLSVLVTAEMAAGFDDEDVHPVYGTASLVRHAEQVSRRLLRPNLGDGEEGVGAEVWVRQDHPVAVGREIEVTATVTEASARRLTTDVAVRAGGRMVAVGRVTQVVVTLAEWRARAART